MARIFQVMQGYYGSRFLNQWQTGQLLQDGQDAGLVNAMAIWGERLAGFEDCPEAIRDALQALPNDPPSLPQFSELCRSAMTRLRGGQAALPHRMTPEEQAKADEAAKKARKAMEQSPSRDPLSWAKQPRSKLAFAEVLKLAAERDARFGEILDGLIRAGVTDGHRLIKRWDGEGWVSA